MNTKQETISFGTWKDWFRFALILAAIAFCILMAFATIYYWGFLFSENSLSTEPTWGHTLIIPVFFIDYWAATLPFISFVYWYKKGRLKPLRECALLGYVVLTPWVSASIVGLLGCIFEENPIGGLIGGVLLGLIVGLVLTLIFGLGREFTDNPQYSEQH
jgi:hypothetical protein